MSEESPALPTVAEVLGRTARELRDGRKVELVARAARLAGLNWGTGRIADLEAGRVSPTLPTLIALAWAFSDLRDEELRLADLFAGEGKVIVTPGVDVPIELLRKALEGPLASPPMSTQLARSGVPVAGLSLDKEDIQKDARRRAREGLPRREVLPNPKVRAVERSMLEQDYRMAHSLGISPELAAIEMETLWGRSFTDERDHRAGPDANPQKRGRISRELKAELREALTDERT